MEVPDARRLKALEDEYATRTPRFTMLLHLPRMEGHGTAKSIKNGPALAGHGAEAVRDAIASTLMNLLRISSDQ